VRRRTFPRRRLPVDRASEEGHQPLDRGRIVGNQSSRTESTRASVLGQLPAHEFQRPLGHIVGQLDGLPGGQSEIPAVREQVVQTDLQSLRAGGRPEWAAVGPLQDAGSLERGLQRGCRIAVGADRIVVFIATTVASDIGGYAAGVLFGKHPMAPTVSPKKSWEGFAGSTVTCVLVGVLGVILLLHGPWWAGVAIGAAAVVTATLGDLSESLIKRDLGIKDMGNLLPGHGGMMDRIDSLLVTAPVVYVLLSLLVPMG